MAADRMQPDDDWLERTLRTDGAERSAEYLADDGFTARVLERLPHPAALPAWRRPVVALLWLVAVAAAATALPDLFYNVFRGLVATVVAQPLTLPRIAVALTVLGAVAWSTIVIAMREE
ncbi:MAG TPA: hypothetical protein VMN79_12465 [Casimicrobiaceae bacterium]|nr:hypothetical protein [Casimicrobiaceae bacterium]